MKTAKRKWFWSFLFLLMVIAAAVYAARVPVGKALFDRAVSSGLASDPLADLPDGLHVGICGSGSPLPDPTRAGPCNFVRAGKQLFVVDIGGGAVRRMGEMRVQPGSVDAVFLTHFHSDHMDGLGELMLQRWAGGGRSAPLPVYGGEGVASLVQGLNDAYVADKGYRVAHHGEEVVPPAGQGGKPMPFALPEDQDRAVVYRKGGVTVTAFRVPHEPIESAFGYRFDYGGRSVVISGDTSKSKLVADACNGCDLMLHEALNKEMVGKVQATFEAQGNRRLAKIMADIRGYHTSPVEAAQIAARGKAKMLVLTHIVPQLPSSLLEGYFMEGVADAYDGPAKLGQDGMLFIMPKNSTKVDQRDLL